MLALSLPIRSVTSCMGEHITLAEPESPLSSILRRDISAISGWIDYPGAAAEIDRFVFYSAGNEIGEFHGVATESESGRILNDFKSVDEKVVYPFVRFYETLHQSVTTS